MWDVGCGIWVMADASRYSPVVGRLRRACGERSEMEMFLQQSFLVDSQAS